MEFFSFASFSTKGEMWIMIVSPKLFYTLCFIQRDNEEGEMVSWLQSITAHETWQQQHISLTFLHSVALDLKEWCEGVRTVVDWKEAIEHLK